MIQIEDLVKSYGDLNAVDHLNLAIDQGEFFGLLGPNGAGKTTLIRMMSALTPVTSGNIFIDGVRMNRDESEIKSKIGLVPQHINLELELTVEENLRLHGKLFKMEKEAMNKRIKELLDFTDLYEKKNVIVKKLSGGMKRKLMIARALMHDPDVLLLDEPSVGLDALSRRKVWDLLKALKQNGLTVVLTTHYIEEAEKLSSLVGFIDKGKIVSIDSPENLIKQSGEVALECFDEQNGTTETYFFHQRQEALEKAKSLKLNFNIRPTNLEDTFIMLANRRVGE